MSKIQTRRNASATTSSPRNDLQYHRSALQSTFPVCETVHIVSTQGRADTDRYERNITKSPLLSLPPEIRNRIWQFALTGYTLHVASIASRRKYSVRVCTHKRGDVEEARRFGEYPYPSFCRSYNHRHTACLIGVPTTDKPAISLLRTCRLAHSEAALLPFVGNCFTFGKEDPVQRHHRRHSALAGENFVKSLRLCQAHAITSVVLHLSNEHLTDPFSIEILSSRLKGLENIICYMECRGIQWELMTSTNAFRNGIAYYIARFRRYRKIKTAMVPIYHADQSPYDRPPKSEIDMLNAWARDVETHLVAVEKG